VEKEGPGEVEEGCGKAVALQDTLIDCEAAEDRAIGSDKIDGIGVVVDGVSEGKAGCELGVLEEDGEDVGSEDGIEGSSDIAAEDRFALFGSDSQAVSSHRRAVFQATKLTVCRHGGENGSNPFGEGWGVENAGDPTEHAGGHKWPDAVVAICGRGGVFGGLRGWWGGIWGVPNVIVGAVGSFVVAV